VNVLELSGAYNCPVRTEIKAIYEIYIPLFSLLTYTITSLHPLHTALFLTKTDPNNSFIVMIIIVINSPQLL
jgi:hypothetical protein